MWLDDLEVTIDGKQIKDQNPLIGKYSLPKR
jgi:hypothetical protein